MTAFEINAEVYHGLSQLADDEESMKKVLKKIKSLIAKKQNETPMMTKAEIMDDFRESCREVQLYKEGEVQLRTLKEALHDLRD